MARVNKTRPERVHTHEGGRAQRVSDKEALRRTVMTCMLWEQTFYEDGVSVADRIKALVPTVSSESVAHLAIEAREEMQLRHVPLLLVRELARTGNGTLVAQTLERVIQRADELAEFVAIYWQQKKQPLSAGVKRGLAKAFQKFNAYQLAKYNRHGAVKLRDVLFLCHAKPKDDDQAATWKKLIDGTLEAPDTWEVALSAGKDKKETFERLLREGHLGGLAVLRNLRNMEQAGVDHELIRARLQLKIGRVLPFRFIAAARHAPRFEAEIEAAMLKATEGIEKLPGKTVLLVDASGSMVGAKVSERSELDRLDAASALAILVREVCEEPCIYVFSTHSRYATEEPGQYCDMIPARRGFALRDKIAEQDHCGTHIGHAVQTVNEREQGFDRLIVLTDEQSQDTVGRPAGRGYMVNVATYENGVGYGNGWTHINGWSERVIDYIRCTEGLHAKQPETTD